MLTHSQHHIAGVRRSAGPLSEVLLSCLQIRGDWGLDSEESTWDFPCKYYLGKYLVLGQHTHEVATPSCESGVGLNPGEVLAKGWGGFGKRVILGILELT